jgi:hypothetical protein
LLPVRSSVPNDSSEFLLRVKNCGLAAKVHRYRGSKDRAINIVCENRSRLSKCTKTECGEQKYSSIFI